jgi:hypothetical protein
MKKSLYTLIALLTLSIATHAQNVGVNTDGSDPDSDALLHVNRTTGVAIDSALIRIENEDNTTANHVTGLEFINSATGPTSTWRFYNPGLGSTDFRINNNGNDYMTILNSGNVGIGTTAPNGILHVENPLTSTDTSEELIVGGGAPHIVIQDLNGNGGLMSSQFLFTDETNAIHAGMGWGDLGATSNITFFRIESSTDDMRLRTAAGDVMSLTTAGLVGIGTTTPDHELHIVSPATGGGGNGPLRLTGRADKDNHIRYDYPSDNTSFWLLGVEFNRGVNNFSLWNNNRGVFDIAVEESTGYVGIGTTNPTEKLHVAGNILATGSITPSDRRYKKDIDTIGNALDLIAQFNGYNYNYRTEEFPEQHFDSTVQVGFIAQELQEVLPQVVSEGSTGYLAVDYAKVTPVLLMAIKEQQAIIEELKTKNNTQNAEIESLKAEASNSSAATNQRLEDLEAKINALLNAQVVTVQK